jgi:hypothetical protein
MFKASGIVFSANPYQFLRRLKINLAAERSQNPAVLCDRVELCRRVSFFPDVQKAARRIADGIPEIEVKGSSLEQGLVPMLVGGK